MNAPTGIDREARVSVFKLNRSQAIRIPKHLAFPDDVKEVIVRRSGNSLIVTPLAKKWSDFFALLPADKGFAVPHDPVLTEAIEPL